MSDVISSEQIAKDLQDWLVRCNIAIGSEEFVSSVALTLRNWGTKISDAGQSAGLWDDVREE